MKKFKGKYIVYLRHPKLGKDGNQVFAHLAGLEVLIPFYGDEYDVVYYVQAYLSEDTLIKKTIEDKKYKTYVFVLETNQLSDEMEAKINKFKEQLDSQ